MSFRPTREFFLRLAIRRVGLRAAIFSDELEVEGSRVALPSFFSLLEAPNQAFAIVTP